MTESKIGVSLREALTQNELALLIDALWSVLPEDGQTAALSRLPADTAQTIRHALQPSAGKADDSAAPPVSVAKQAQIWQEHWQKWYNISRNAGDEEGAYVAQEHHWEAPYYDSYALSQDLEEVAANLLPMIPAAVEYQFSPDADFFEALADLEGSITAGMPEWIYVEEGFEMGQKLTRAALTWEWLNHQQTGEDGFAFATTVLDEIDQLSYAHPDFQTVTDFFVELPQTTQQEIYQGMKRHKTEAPWKVVLDNVHDYWHALYLYYMEQFDSSQLLGQLRQTIPNWWANGLTVLEELLAQKNYQTCEAVLKETWHAMLRAERIGEDWQPEQSLLVIRLLNRYSYGSDYLTNHKRLLRYDQQVAAALNQPERANLMQVQLAAFKQLYNWSKMLDTFATVSLPAQITQALRAAWQQHNVKAAKSSTYYRGSFGSAPKEESWWLQLLLEAVVDEQKETTWFQQRLQSWLAQLPPDDPGNDVDRLRLLTKDVLVIAHGEAQPYPRFYQTAIMPRSITTPNDVSRQHYLQRYLPDGFPDKLLAYWRGCLHNLVPKPEQAHKSQYENHAAWMVALRELNPERYETLLSRWQREHHRRRNLWKAMAAAGLTT